MYLLLPSHPASLPCSISVKYASVVVLLSSVCRSLFKNCQQGRSSVAKNYYDITIALAGICQSARLVQQLAHQGHCDNEALQSR